MKALKVGLLLTFCAMLTACVGANPNDQAQGGTSGTGPGTGPGTGTGTGTGSSTKSCEELLTKKVQPRLAFCRNCHVPGGVADVDDGRAFMLATDPALDMERLTSSWLALGSNRSGKSRILRMASGTDTRSHTGGAPWPPGSDAYVTMDTLLLGLENPSACTGAAGGSPPTPDLPLLGSARGGHYWDSFCEGKADSTPLPPDPRTLVVPGVSEGKAVMMNAWWQTCQTDNQPADCGSHRARVARGFPIVASDGEIGAGSMFSGNSPTSNFSFTADSYNTLWSSVLNLPARPDNFDELMSQRWGMPLSITHNPYPLPGENPNATNGGSGHLPIGLTQLRQADGTWTGRLNATCSICHGGEVGKPSDGAGLGPLYGTNSQSDITVMFTDLGKIAPQQSALSAISQNKVRGTGNITNFQLFGTLTFADDSRDNAAAAARYASVQTQPSTGTEDPPVWWNVGHRPSKFFDGGQVMDSKRIELSFHFPNATSPNNQAGRQWILDHQQDSDAWIASLRAPAWPEAKLGSLNLTLAQQGAILFHAKDLWAPELKNPIPRPEGGNGSCASCHGAYSPRYVHDPAYLANPVLEGIAAYITPIEIIGTDRKRLDGNSQLVSEYARYNWFAYNDGPYNAAGVSLCGDQNDSALRGARKLGYLAPPLYGVWATAPYFHNGAVPNLWEVLKPSDRKSIWRRISKPARADQTGLVVMGFDTSLTAYDSNKVGWRYDALMCGVVGTMPYLDCNPEGTVTLQDALGLLWANGGLAWNLLNVPIMNNAQIEERKIYNTNMYSQRNTGHDFTAVLTDSERRALIEYLKTL